MLNLHELEQRWLRYKIKSYLPYVAIALSLIVITTSLTLFLRDPKKVVITTKREIKAQPIKNTSLSQESKTVILSPSLGFMKKMQTEVQPYYNNENSIIQKKREESKNQQKVQTESKTLVEITQKEKPKSITITTDNRYSDIKKIIQRFKKNNNPALSLFIAKKYYKAGKYRETRNYALITNNINQDIEASWLLFSKALVKLGEKKKAIKTLQRYIAYSHSHSAAILLDEIRSGKFR